jgi:hypothetical protein
MTIRRILPAIAFLMPCIGLAQADQPPKHLVDKGACPSECCSYGTWKTTRAVTLLKAPDSGAPQVASLRKALDVEAQAGEVHSTPSKFVVQRPHGGYQPGDVLWVYTYTGEGNFKVWFRGKTYVEELGFSPYGGSSGSRCEDAAMCWGTLQSDLQSTWWVRIKAPNEQAGWTSDTEAFSNKDRCGN